METLNNNKSKRYFTIGILLLTIGVISILQNIGLFLPDWVLSWHTLMLAIGLLIGYGKNFKSGGWMLFVIVGGIFTLISMITLSLAPYTAALLFISLGLYLLLKPAKSHNSCGFKAEKEE